MTGYVHVGKVQTELIDKKLFWLLIDGMKSC